MDGHVRAAAPRLVRAWATRIRGRVVSTSATANPLVCSALRSWVTLAVGRACRSTANAPVTCGVAIDVPLRIPNVAGGSDDRMLLPGAKSNRNGATFENDETRSALVVEATLIALEMQAGELMPFRYPLLPDAMTAAMPTERRLSMTGLRASPSQKLVFRAELPRLMFTAAMVYWLRSR